MGAAVDRLHRLDVFLFRRVMRVEEEAAEPAWPKDRKEKILDLGADLRDVCLHHLELMLVRVFLYCMGPVITALCVGVGLTTPGRGMLPGWSEMAQNSRNSGMCRSCWCTRMEAPSPGRIGRRAPTAAVRALSR